MPVWERDDEPFVLGERAEVRHLGVDLRALGEAVKVEHQRQRRLAVVRAWRCEQVFALLTVNRDRSMVGVVDDADVSPGAARPPLLLHAASKIATARATIARGPTCPR